MGILLGVKAIEQVIRRKGIRFVDLIYCDLPGRLRHVTLPAARLEAALREGVGFDSSSVAGFRAVDSGDMVLKPDIGSAFVDPFAAQPTLAFFAEVFDPATGRRYERDPRFILERALTALKKAARADEVMVRPEFEFYLFNSAEFWTDAASAVYRIETDELRHDDHTGLALFKGPAYHVAPPFDRSSDFRSELAMVMEECGLPVKYHHHEGGRFSQVEVETSYLPAKRAADGIVLTKYLVRNLAYRRGKSATFMPKPIHGEPGSGMHLHQYLVRDGVSLFGAAGRPGMLSSLGRHYIGGILEHAPSLCALTNPSTNSYKRLVPGFEAPVEVFYSFANRTAAIRIPAYVTSARRMAIEYRIPDATANPYLALAAVFMAARDGVKRKLNPGLPLGGRDGAGSDSSGRRLPTSLARAFDELRRDSEYLSADGVFSAETLAKWVELKAVEVDAVAKRPHPWEFSLYYGC